MPDTPSAPAPRLTADAVRRLLDLRPLEPEGGYFAETYRARESLPATALPPRYAAGVRASSTAIYYLLTPDTFSAIHRLASDEVFHFYLGDPVEMLWLEPRGVGRRLVLGTDLVAGQLPQLVVPHGVWQGARLVPGGAWGLLGCTVAPGFDYADFEMAERRALLQGWPAHAELIEALTR